jgi:hypothetical protein
MPAMGTKSREVIWGGPQARQGTRQAFGVTPFRLAAVWITLLGQEGFHDRL